MKSCPPGCDCICFNTLCRCAQSSLIDNIHIHEPQMSNKSSHAITKSYNYCNFLVFAIKVVVLSFK